MSSQGNNMYLLEPGADPGLILGCFKILQKKIENGNDITMQKKYRSSKKQEAMILITVGVQISFKSGWWFLSFQFANIFVTAESRHNNTPAELELNWKPKFRLC